MTKLTKKNKEFLKLAKEEIAEAEKRKDGLYFAGLFYYLFGRRCVVCHELVAPDKYLCRVHEEEYYNQWARS